MTESQRQEIARLEGMKDEKIFRLIEECTEINNNIRRIKNKKPIKSEEQIWCEKYTKCMIEEISKLNRIVVYPCDAEYYKDFNHEEYVKYSDVVSLMERGINES
ncbi:MAG: hypothetical protein HUJ53_01600 [Holdemanella sp.]|nr:hypothetical protein [Holdemanella sp.]